MAIIEDKIFWELSKNEIDERDHDKLPTFVPGLNMIFETKGYSTNEKSCGVRAKLRSKKRR